MSLTVDFRRLRFMSARQLTYVLEREGFDLVKRNGDHHLYRNPDGRRVNVTFHQAGTTFPPGIMRSMVEKQIHWTDADIRRLGILG